MYSICTPFYTMSCLNLGCTHFLKVANKVSVSPGKNNNSNLSQISQTVTTLRKKWYFLPGKEFIELEAAQRANPEFPPVSKKLATH